jgi:hypothetical protein
MDCSGDFDWENSWKINSKDKANLGSFHPLYCARSPVGLTQIYGVLWFVGLCNRKGNSRSPFGSAQGRLFGDDNLRDKGNNNSKTQN